MWRKREKRERKEKWREKDGKNDREKNMREKVVTLHKSTIKYNWKTNKEKNEREEKRVFSGVDKFKCCVTKGRRKKGIQDREGNDRKEKEEREGNDKRHEEKERKKKSFFIELLFSCLLEPVLKSFAKFFSLKTRGFWNRERSIKVLKSTEVSKSGEIVWRRKVMKSLVPLKCAARNVWVMERETTAGKERKIERKKREVIEEKERKKD